MSNNIDNEIAQGYADFADDTDVTVENSENISEVVDKVTSAYFVHKGYRVA